ncbi:MAG: peptidylprolyl isomerase [Verrucomicrobiota bacterium]
MSKKATLKTSHGDMTFEFWNDVAPNTVDNFLKLAGESFYDGTAFHRIIDGFMIQGGDPLSKEGDHPAVGTGGPGYQIDAEFNEKKHTLGVLSMARSSNPNSAGSQFFICLGDTPSLDGQYTGFGKLVAGEDVLVKIGKTPVVHGAGGEKSKPTERVEIQSIEVTEG